ncbi:MAG: EamA family transporter RarD [Prevotellaceae bacterium]|jgi:chloramphenicol-sensitive protein RarD|nr:EamA family transporter RarD [Prevotellaceae bacterium]
MSKTTTTGYNQGLALCAACYILWGIFPLYWKLLKNVTSPFVLGNRILWSAVFLTVFCIIQNRKAFVNTISNKVNIKYMSLAGALIAVNWGTFIYAVNNGYLIESSLGYYINPLVNIMMGMLFFKERLNVYEKISAILAFIGVVYMAVSYGSLPVIGLVLAFSFSLYGVIKKKAGLPVAPALALENILILPVALIYFTWVYNNIPEVYSSLTLSESILLVLGGLVTAFPLLLFAKAVKLISYTTVGFLQYIGPTLQLIIAVAIFHEEFTPSHWICFGFIWLGLTVFTINLIRKGLNK